MSFKTQTQRYISCVILRIFLSKSHQSCVEDLSVLRSCKFKFSVYNTYVLFLHQCIFSYKVCIVLFFLSIFPCWQMLSCLFIQVTAVTFNDTSEQVISGGIDNDMKVSCVLSPLYSIICQFIILIWLLDSHAVFLSSQQFISKIWHLFLSSILSCSVWVLFIIP